jgi:hypothetical protein
MNRFEELAILFHSLIGLCAGWMLGARHSFVFGLLMASVGCAAGFVAGFLMSRIPKALRLIRTDAPMKHRCLATAYALSGVGLGLAFWSACINCAGF